MFYRIKNKLLFDYADYKYADDCLETNIINKIELDKDIQQVIVQGKKIILNPDYDTIKVEKETLKKIDEIKVQIDELDKKRVRAMAEPSQKDKNKTWLEYYNEQVDTLRKKIIEYDK